MNIPVGQTETFSFSWAVDGSPVAGGSGSVAFVTSTNGPIRYLQAGETSFSTTPYFFPLSASGTRFLRALTVPPSASGLTVSVVAVHSSGVLPVQSTVFRAWDVTAREIDSALTAHHGSGTWVWVTPGSAVFEVSTVDQASGVIGGARVDIRPSGASDASALVTAFTNSSTGKVLVNLDEGVYDFYAQYFGVAVFPNPIRGQVVNGGRVVLVGSRLTIPVAPTGNKVLLYGYFRDVALNPVAGVEMTAQVSGHVPGPVGITIENLAARSDGNGYASLEVAASTPVRVRVPKIGLDRSFVTPAVGVLDVSSVA